MHKGEYRLTIVIHPKNHYTDFFELKEVVVENPKQDKTHPPEPILTEGYLLNGFVTVATTFTQAGFNRLIDNNNFNVPVGKDTWLTMTNTTFTHISNKMVKGNYLNVRTAGQQTLVLVGYVSQAVLFDLLAYSLPIQSNQTLPIGQTTVLTTVNAFGYFSAMAAAGLLGKGTCMLVDTKVKKERTHMAARRLASCTLLAFIAMGAATINRKLIGMNSSLTPIISHANTEAVNKIFKAGQATEERTSKKVLLLGCYGITAVAADMFIGFVLPSSMSLTSPWRYFGPVSTGTALEFAKVSAKALLDHDRDPNAIIVDDVEIKKRARSRTIKGIIAGIISAIMPLVAIAANHSHLASTTPAAALLIKQVQHSLTTLAAQEVFKAVDGAYKRVMAIAAPVVIALSGDLIANWLDPTKSSFSATSISMGTAGSYMAVIASSWLIGRDDEDN